MLFTENIVPLTARIARPSPTRPARAEDILAMNKRGRVVLRNGVGTDPPAKALENAIQIYLELHNKVLDASDLQAQVSDLQAQVSDLQTQVSDLRAQMSDLPIALWDKGV